MFCSPFPMVAEAVQEELEDYKTKEDEVRRLKRAMVNDFSLLNTDIGICSKERNISGVDML